VNPVEVEGSDQWSGGGTALVAAVATIATGDHGIPLRDEIELDQRLRSFRREAPGPRSR
jgi:hypothetical protein